MEEYLTEVYIHNYRECKSTYGSETADSYAMIVNTGNLEPFIKGFVEGALEVWESVKDEI